MMKTLILTSFCILSVLARPNQKAVDACSADNCITDAEHVCRCSSTTNPVANAPQLVAITINEPISQLTYNQFWKPLLFDKKNKDGSPVGATFFVPHQYTDYTLVHDLWARGYEIGDYSISTNSNNSYWSSANLDDLKKEFTGQKTIIQNLANIPEGNIIGGRTPLLELEGDVSINSYVDAELQYDNTLPSPSTEHILPYTLDFATTQTCTGKNCPKEAHVGFWEVPISEFKYTANAADCSSIATCLTEDDATKISDWLYNQVINAKAANRAPITFVLESAWLGTLKNSYAGFADFLTKITKEDGVFLVGVRDIVDWLKAETPVDAPAYKGPNRVPEDLTDCYSVICQLKDQNGNDVYLKICGSCPAKYPWLGNANGN